MKFSRLSQLFLVSSIGLLVAVLLTACQIVTIDYVFVAASSSSGASSSGQIQAFAVDAESGAVRNIAPAVSSGGANPIAMAVSSDFNNLYVANADGSVVHFSIAYNGVLTKKESVTLGTLPVALTVGADNKYLFVVSGSSSATLTEFPLASGVIGAAAATESLSVPGYGDDTIVPTGVTVLTSGAAVYATAYDRTAYNPGGSTSSSANPGWVFGFAIGSGGALAPTAHSPYQAGVKPSAIVAEPTNRFVYVTDYASNQLIGYTLLDATTLNFLTNGPFRTGSQPTSILVDPRGKFIYNSNALDSSVSAYEIVQATGTPSPVVNPTGSATNSTDTQPVAIAIDPALGRFIYTANYLGNSLSGFRLDSSTGTLKQTQSTPYPTGPHPTALVLVPHGNHAIQAVAP